MNDRASTIASNLAQHVDSRHALLEIGAGKGRVARALHQATGVDIELVDVVDYNETELLLRLYDGRQLPFDDCSFDYSLLIFVLHHTPDPLIVLREALRVSRLGLLVVENHVAGPVRRPITRIFDSIPHFQHGVPICYHTMTIDEWHGLVAQVPARARLLSRFSLGFFWQNFITRIEKEG